MAMESIGAKIVLEGEKEYRKALKDIGSDQKELRSEMQLTSAQYAENQNSLEALEKKYDILGRQIEEQTKKINVYEEAVAKAKEMQAEASKSVDEYSKELDSARAELDKMRNSEDASADSIKAQEERVAELEKALANSEEAYSKSTQIVNNWQTGLNNSQATLIGLQNDLEKTGKYLDEASNSTDKCATSIDNYGREIKDAEDKTLTFGDVMKANLASEVVMAGLEKIVELTAQAGEGIYNMAVSASRFADDTQTLSVQTGVAVETIQALTYSEELLDVSVNTVTSSMAKNIRSMQSAKDGSEKYASAYAELGVQITDTNGNLRDSEDVFWDVVDALGKMQNATERDAISMQVFGRNAQALNPLIKAGSDGFNKLKQEAIDLGYVLDADTQASLLETSDSMERVSKATDALKNQIGAELSGSITEFAEKMLKVFEENEDKIVNFAEKVIPALADALGFVVDNLDKILPVVTGIGAGFVTFEVASGFARTLSTAMAFLKGETIAEAEAQGLLNTVMNANPIVLMTTAIFGLGTAMATAIGFSKPMQNEYTELIDAVNADTESIQNNMEKREESKNKMGASRTITEKLKNELNDLSKKTSLTADEQSRMNQIVSELNQAIPDLNLYIDEQTGKLSQNNDELEQNIEDWQNYYDLQFAQNDMVQSMNDLYIAERDLAQVEADLTKVREELSGYNHLANSVEDKIAIIELEASESALIEKQEELNNQIEELNRNYEDDNSTVQELSATYENFGQTTEEVLEKADVALVNYHNHLITVTGEEATKLLELQNAYNEAKQSAKDSLEEQIGLFDKLSNKSDLSVKQMKENLDSQTEVMNTYKDDMLKAVDLVEKGLMDEGLLGQIQEMGISGAGYLHELVEASEKDIDSFQAVMDSFADQTKAKDELAGTLAEIQTNFEETQQAIAENIVETQNNISENTEHWKENHKELWENTYDEANSAILKKHDTVVKSAFAIVDDILKTSQDVLGIDANGKSAEGDAIGTSYVESMANAILNGEGMVVNAVNTVASKALEEARARVQEIDRLLGEGM